MPRLSLIFGIPQGALKTFSPKEPAPEVVVETEPYLLIPPREEKLDPLGFVDIVRADEDTLKWGVEAHALLSPQRSERPSGPKGPPPAMPERPHESLPKRRPSPRPRRRR